MHKSHTIHISDNFINDLQKIPSEEMSYIEEAIKIIAKNPSLGTPLTEENYESWGLTKEKYEELKRLAEECLEEGRKMDEGKQ